MSLKRSDTLLSIYEFITKMSYLDIRGVYGTTTVNCVVDTYRAKGCDYLWGEYPFQRVNSPSRVMLTERIKEAEKRISDVLGYYVGPTIKQESQVLTNWYDTIKTDKKKVLAAGTETFTRVGDSVPTTRTFYDSGGWGFNDTVRYTFGDVGTPFTLTDEEVCNLFVFPSTQDLQKEYRLRPFTIVQETNQVHIDISVYVSVDITQYNKFPTTQSNGKINAVDICDENNIISQISLYVRTFELPSGKVSLGKDYYCTCNNIGTCKVCVLETLDICLQPLNADEGIFNVIPIINTEVDPLLPPCWEKSNIAVCCQHYNLNHPYECFCNKPLNVTFNYLSGCGGSWGDSCILDGACDIFQFAIALLTTGLMPKICDCACLDEAFSYYQRDLRLSKKEGTRVNFVDMDLFKLGSTQGAVDAYTLIKDDINIRFDSVVLV